LPDIFRWTYLIHPFGPMLASTMWDSTYVDPYFRRLSSWRRVAVA
jgi:hypothetical protein